MPQQTSSTRASGRCRMCAKALRGAPSPDMIERKRKQVVQKIVARRDLAEHPLHMRGRFAFVARAFGSRSRQLSPFSEALTVISRAISDDPVGIHASGLKCRLRAAIAGSSANARATTGHGTSMPHSVFPMRRGKTHSTRPPRAFLSPARMGRNSVALESFRAAEADRCSPPAE